MPAKVKPRTGAAVVQDPDDDTQSTDTGPSPGGFTSTPAAPAPSGPPFGMGGDVTQPSDFAKEVAAATNVPSKGGPAVEDLYASSGKGPVGKLRRPQESDSTTKPPEAMPLPTLDQMQLGPARIQQPAATPTATAPAPAPSAQAPPPAAAAPSPVSTDQAQPASPPPNQSGLPLDAEGKSLPAFANHSDLIEQFAKPYQAGDQDYSRLDPYITHDPDFAGLINGQPFFMGADRRPYMRDETGPGKEIRHYADSPAGSHEAENGVTVEDEAKASMSRDAQQRMLALLQTQDAINNWKSQLKKYQDTHGDENPLQRQALQALESGQTDWGSNLWRGAAEMFQGPLGVSKEMKDLDAARAQAANAYAQSIAKNLPTGAAEKTTLNVPITADDFDTQQSKVQGMQDAIEREARTLQVLYPYGNRQVETLLTKIGKGQAKQQPAAGQNAPAASTARATATPAPSSTPARPAAPPDVTNSADAYARLKSGDAFIYKGKTYRKQ